MLIIDLESYDLWNETEEMFVKSKPMLVKLEHSLISISKWEAIWNKPFISTNPKDPRKSTKELKSYLECMVIGTIPDYMIDVLWHKHGRSIEEYIDAPNTATKINRTKENKPASRSFVTSELIYYWMIAFHIPFECQQWHLNRLLTLIEICNIKQSGKKMSKSEVLNRNRELNNKRRQSLNTSG